LKPRIKGDWARFTFPRLTIATPRGILNVVVGSAFVVTTGEAGDRECAFSTSRTVTFTPVGGNERRVPEASGGSETKMPMPSPSEVLSFEMPPLPNPDGGPPLPDRVSIRVRIRPVQ
jgi:hypothetical protein